jgi:hypothetical protein
MILLIILHFIQRQVSNIKSSVGKANISLQGHNYHLVFMAAI